MEAEEKPKKRSYRKGRKTKSVTVRLDEVDVELLQRVLEHQELSIARFFQRCIRNVASRLFDVPATNGVRSTP